MDILFESYNDGHREVVVDGVRYFVDETRSWTVSSACPTGDRLPARVSRHKCRPVEIRFDEYWGGQCEDRN